MKHYVVQETRRWEFIAKSFTDAKKQFAKINERPPYEVEETVLVEEETGREERLNRELA